MHIPIITGFYAGLLGLVLVFLIVRVARTRARVRVSLQDGGDRELGVAIRQHGNFIETVPMCLILMGILEMEVLSTYIIHLLGIILVLCRLIHPFGLSFERGYTWQRMIGAGGTTIVLLVLACLAIYMFAVRLTLAV